MSDRKWFYGKFRLDCALGNKVKEPLDNIVRVPYYIEEGKYFFPLDETLQECIELPIKTSEEYPFSTGLDTSDCVEMSEDWVILCRNNWYNSIDFQQEISIIHDVRANRKDEWTLLREKDLNWVPYSLSDEEYIPSKFEKEYNANFYNIKYCEGEKNRKYLWKMVSFDAPKTKESIHSETITLPVGVSFNLDEYVTYLKKWKLTSIFLPDYAFRCGQDASHAEVLNWYAKADKKIFQYFIEMYDFVNKIEYDKKSRIKFENLSTLLDISSIFHGAPSFLASVNDLSEFLNTCNTSDKSLYIDYISYLYKINNFTILNEKKSHLLMRLFNNNYPYQIDHLDFYDDEVLSYSNHCEFNRSGYDLVPHVMVSTDFYNTNDVDFLGLKFADVYERMKLFNKEKFNEYFKFLISMLKSAFEDLGLDLRIFEYTSTDTIFVPYASLYLDKSLYDLYEAMILKRDTDIHFMCVSRDEENQPIVKKGILHQYGSNQKFTFEEQKVQVLEFDGMQEVEEYLPNSLVRLPK